MLYWELLPMVDIWLIFKVGQLAAFGQSTYSPIFVSEVTHLVFCFLSFKVG